MAPSPITAMQLFLRALKSRPTAMPSAAETDVDEWPAPKGSYSDSARLVKPERPPPCLMVDIFERRPSFFFEVFGKGGRGEEKKKVSIFLLRVSFFIFFGLLFLSSSPPQLSLSQLFIFSPVRILCPYAWCPTSHTILSSGVLNT